MNLAVRAAPETERRRAGPRPEPKPVSPLLRAAALLLAITAAGCNAGARPSTRPVPSPSTGPADRAFLDSLEEKTFHYFWDLGSPVTGLVPDRAPTPSFSSIAAVGFALAGYSIGAERGYITRAQARKRVLATLEFFAKAPQGERDTGVAGYKGFFYHFLHMDSGLRFEIVELSTIDTALLLSGALVCQSYFDREDEEEAAIRSRADELFRRADWRWAQPNPPAITHGWTPEHGFLPYDWRGYNEAMILYILALGSPTHGVEENAWWEYVRTYKWSHLYGQDYVGFGPLFGHQFSHVWIDFRGIRDAYMRGRGIDYFENSRRATYAQREYAIQNPMGWRGYGPDVWGLTACDGPADVTLEIDGRHRTFHTYAARGVSEKPTDDGTLSPAAAAGSLPFAPEIALPALREMRGRYGDHAYATYGFLDAFNPTFRIPFRVTHGRIEPEVGWFDTDYLGIDQGLILAMIENYRSDLLWRILRRNPYIVAGLKRAGFSGGWLEPSVH
jgi:hypothetical protein